MCRIALFSWKKFLSDVGGSNANYGHPVIIPDRLVWDFIEFGGGRGSRRAIAVSGLGGSLALHSFPIPGTSPGFI